MSKDQLNATLIERQDLTPELAIFRVKPDDGPITPFTPGQYTTLGLPQTWEEAEAEAAERSRKRGKTIAPKQKLILRAYSIASPPMVTDYLEFFLVIVDDGALTPKLWQLREGDRLFMGPKVTGKFTLDDVPPGKDLIMVATGTGLAPYISMLEHYRGTGRWNRFVVVHGTRLAQDLAYSQKLERRAAEDPSVYYIPTVTREPDGSDWEGLRGRIPVVLQPDVYGPLTDGGVIDPDQCHVFLCGNPAMIDQVSEQLTAQGFVVKDRDNPEGNIHFESYW